MDLNSNGTIPYEIDWINHAKEIYSVMNELQISYKSIYLAHAMPEALSLVLGMAIENYWNLTAPADLFGQAAGVIRTVLK